MKITEQTTLAELQAYLVTLGNPVLTLMRRQPRAAYAYQTVAYLGGSFNGEGPTIAASIEDALGSLRSALGITNLAYEPLNYVREKAALNKFRQADDIYGPQCEANGQCEDIKGDGTCFGCGRWLGVDDKRYDTITCPLCSRGPKP